MLNKYTYNDKEYELLSNLIKEEQKEIKKKSKKEIKYKSTGVKVDIINNKKVIKRIIYLGNDNNKYVKLNKEYEDKEEELERIKETTIQQMWLYELELLEKEYEVFCDERKNALLGELNTKDTSNKKQSSNKNKIVITSKKIVKKASNIDFIQEDNEEEIIDFTPKNKKK